MRTYICRLRCTYGSVHGRTYMYCSYLIHVWADCCSVYAQVWAWWRLCAHIWAWFRAFVHIQAWAWLHSLYVHLWAWSHSCVHTSVGIICTHVGMIALTHTHLCAWICFSIHMHIGIHVLKWTHLSRYAYRNHHSSIYIHSRVCHAYTQPCGRDCYVHTQHVGHDGACSCEYVNAWSLLRVSCREAIGSVWCAHINIMYAVMSIHTCECDGIHVYIHV